MALPITQQVLLDIVAPPILAGSWWGFSRASAAMVQGGTVSKKRRIRQKRGFLIVLGALYLVMFGGTIYFNLR